MQCLGARAEPRTAILLEGGQQCRHSRAAAIAESAQRIDPGRRAQHLVRDIERHQS